ncbi:GNAT family N-acetyltransferase [Candidatus Woesearchaeota archaeon]|nr:GNAT family N-acetyltransferase [Candidatus Woesearchaeota archaeon]MBT4248651.1 GNAT family N-acetyltransferase [Candidatus Woesearchaeota archaeon]
MKCVIRRAQPKDAKDIAKMEATIGKELHDMYVIDPKLKDFAQLCLNDPNFNETPEIRKKLIQKSKKDEFRVDEISYVAVVNNKVIGMVEASVRKSKASVVKRMGGFHTLYIHKQFRGRGYGTQLMEKMMNWFRSREVEYVGLGVDVPNKSAIKMYSKLGFKLGGYQMKIKLQ